VIDLPGVDVEPHPAELGGDECLDGGLLAEGAAALHQPAEELDLPLPGGVDRLQHPLTDLLHRPARLP
jgi:hypothetical protein